MGAHRRWLGLAALSTAGAIALGAGFDVAHADRGAPLYRRHVVDEARLVVDLPARWPTLRPHDARFPGTARTLTVRHEDLAPLLLALAQPDSGLRLLAFDPRSTGTVTANLTIQVEQAAPAPWRAWTGPVVSGIRRSGGLVGPVRATRVRVPAGKALRVDYERTPLGSDTQVSLTRVYVARGGVRTTLSFAFGPGQRGRYEPTLTRVLGSLDVLR